MGVHAFSVFEVPDHDFEELARLEPILLSRPKLLEASGPDLLTAGFPLLPTANYPHWSVVLSEPTATKMATMTVHADLVFDPNDVGPDCVVECWICQGPRADDSSFDPRPGDRVTLVDEDRETLQGRVTSRDGNRVWVQVEIPGLMSQSA